MMTAAAKIAKNVIILVYNVVIVIMTAVLNVPLKKIGRIYLLQDKCALAVKTLIFIIIILDIYYFD